MLYWRYVINDIIQASPIRQPCRFLSYIRTPNFMTRSELGWSDVSEIQDETLSCKTCLIEHIWKFTWYVHDNRKNKKKKHDTKCE